MIRSDSCFQVTISVNDNGVFCYHALLQAPVFHKVGNIQWMSHYPEMGSTILVFFILICWIVIYLVDGTIKRFNNKARFLRLLVGKKSEYILIKLLGVLEKVCFISSLLPTLSNSAGNC